MTEPMMHLRSLVEKTPSSGAARRGALERVGRDAESAPGRLAFEPPAK